MTKGTIESSAEGAENLAKAVMHRRVLKGFRSARAFAAHIGMDYRTITAIENATRTSFQRSTLTQIDIGLDWKPGQAEELLKSKDELLAEHLSQRIELEVRYPQATQDVILIAREVAQNAFDSVLEQLA